MRVSVDLSRGVAVLEIAKTYVPPLRPAQITRGVVAYLDASGRCISVEVGDERRRRPNNPKPPEVVLLTGTDARFVMQLLGQIAVGPAPTPPPLRVIRRKGPGVDVDPAKLRDARLAAGLSLAAVAGSELSKASIHLYETGQVRPSRRALELIAQRTNRSIESFLKGADPAEA